MKENRVLQIDIGKNNSSYKTIDELCFKSKNLYNYANYIIRQEFINNNIWIRQYSLDKIIQQSEPYKVLGSQAAQKVLMQLDQCWKSFFKAIKDWSKNPHKYLGKPRLPNYKDKNGRNLLMIKNIQCRVEDNFIYFSWKPLKELNNHFIFPYKDSKIIQIRFIPKTNKYVMEVVYEIDIPDLDIKNDRIIGIDIGLNNLMTVTNNIGLKPFVVNGKPLKSTNQYYNKEASRLKSETKIKNKQDWSNRLQKLTDKRNNKIKDYIHKSSKYIIDYCINNKIDTIIIGKNKNWKQESGMSKKVNQNFIQIPFAVLIDQIVYKARTYGIQTIITEECYTSGTSFLDGEEPIKKNYNKSRRLTRGLFKSEKGVMINADVNGSYQIIKKVFPNLFDGIEGVGLHPVVVNL